MGPTGLTTAPKSCTTSKRNSTTAAKPTVVLYDYGSVVSISHEHRLALLKLLDITRQESGDPYTAIAALGFNQNLLSPIRPSLAALCRTLFEPFCRIGRYDLSGWRRGERVDDIVGEDRWNFRMSGPAPLILLMRAFRGLTYYLERLRANVSWYVAATPHLGEHHDALDRIDASAAPDQVGTFDAMGKHLRIRVTENGATKVRLTFPGPAVENLRELMGDVLLDRISSKGIDIDEIVRDVRGGLYRPRTLFELDETASAKGVTVRIE